MLVNRAFTVLVVAACAVAGSCREVAAPIPVPASAAVYVRFPDESLFVGQRNHVIAVASGEDSAAVAWPEFTWTSSDTTVAVVDSAGNVLGLDEGSTIVTAEFGGLHDSIAIRVVLREMVPGASFAKMSVGENILCALSVAGGAYCSPWALDETPPVFSQKALPPSVALVSLAAARAHQCGLSATGQMYCWGNNSAGQFLTGRTVPRDVTGEAVEGGGTRRFNTIAIGDDGAFSPNQPHTCAIDASDARVLCAGRNDVRQLGHTGPALDSVVAPTSNALTARSISSTTLHTCAIDLTSALWCWGGYIQGNPDDASPRVVAPGMQFNDVFISSAKLCALTTGGELWCRAVTGSPPITGSLSHEAAGTTFQRVIAGRISGGSMIESYVCGITLEGALYCWGDFPPTNLSSRLGARRLSPVALATGTRFTSIAADRHHLCGVTTTNKLVCF